MDNHGAMTAPPKIEPRIAKVVVGPPGAAGLLFEQEDFTGATKSYKGSKPNEAQVTIHNLSEATIAQLEAPGQVLQIQAGTSYVGQLFIGSVAKRGVATKNDLPNRTTTITARDGRRVYRDTMASVSYPPNTAVAVVVQDLLKLATAQGMALGTGSVFPTDVFPAGWAHQGKWRQALTEILAPRGLYWTIQGHVIYVLNEASTAPGNVPLLTPHTGLIGSPTRTDKGCDITSVLNAAIIAGRGLQVTSQFFDGLYRAAVVEHRFSRDGLTWTTAAQCEVIK